MALPTEKLPGGLVRRASPLQGRATRAPADLSSFSVVDVPVILQQFQQCFDLKVPQIQFIDSGRIFLLCCRDGYHSANCADDRRDSSGAALGPVLDMPVIVQRQLRSSRCQGRRHVCRGAEAVSFGLDCSDNHSDSPVAVH